MSELNCNQLVDMMPREVVFGTIEHPLRGTLQRNLVALRATDPSPPPENFLVAIDDQHCICRMDGPLFLPEARASDVMGVYALQPGDELVIATGLCFVQCKSDLKMSDAVKGFEQLGCKVVGAPDPDTLTVWLAAKTERVADGLRMADTLRSHAAVARLEVQALRQAVRKTGGGSLAPPPG